jgi:hypothetical protein
MARDAADRIDTLAARVRWLDRYHRAVSLFIAGGVWVVLAYELALLFGESSPSVTSAIVGFMFAALGWWLVEAGFAWTIALFEVEHERLARDRGLPTAVLLRRK